MIGTCDFCEEDQRKLKYLYQDGVAILATCRYGCHSKRSIPSAKNRNRPFSIISIEKLSGGFEDSQWRVKVKDERGRIRTHDLKRYGNETEVTLRHAISKKCINAKQTFLIYLQACTLRGLRETMDRNVERLGRVFYPGRGRSSYRPE